MEAFDIKYTREFFAGDTVGLGGSFTKDRFITQEGDTMKMRLLTPAYYIENRLLVGGALAFCSAVVLHLLQIPPAQLALSTSLTAALWTAAVAMPLLVSPLWIYAAHESVERRYETGYPACLGALGLLATFMCAGAIFMHFSKGLGFVFLGVSGIALCCGILDGKYHKGNASRAP